MNINNGEKTNCEFLMLDEHNNILNGNLNLNFLLYNFLISSNKLPSKLRYESEKNAIEKEITINNFQTGFQDLNVNTIIQGYLTLDNITYTIVIYNIDWINDNG